VSFAALLKTVNHHVCCGGSATNAANKNDDALTMNAECQRGDVDIDRSAELSLHNAFCMSVICDRERSILSNRSSREKS
jgi:hypothetical protein